jgi:hypothetical protein
LCFDLIPRNNISVIFVIISRQNCDFTTYTSTVNCLPFSPPLPSPSPPSLLSLPSPSSLSFTTSCSQFISKLTSNESCPSSNYYLLDVVLPFKWQSLKSKIRCWRVGVLACWRVGVLACWRVGVLACYCVGVLVC